MLHDPGMIEARVIGDEVEDQAHATRPQLLVNGLQIIERADARVRFVALDGKRRADDIAHPPARQSDVKIMKTLRIGAEDATAKQAAMPRSEQVNQIKAEGGEAVPLFGWHVGEGESLAMLRRQLLQPDPCVDLVKMQVRAAGKLARRSWSDRGHVFLRGPRLRVY